MLENVPEIPSSLHLKQVATSVEKFCLFYVLSNCMLNVTTKHFVRRNIRKHQGHSKTAFSSLLEEYLHSGMYIRAFNLVCSLLKHFSMTLGKRNWLHA